MESSVRSQDAGNSSGPLLPLSYKLEGVFL